MDYGDIYTFINRNQSKPLNVQIEEMIDYLGGYNLEPSDEVYYTSNSEKFIMPSVTSEAKAVSLPFSLKFNLGGTARIKLSMSNSRCRARIYINNMAVGNVGGSDYLYGTAVSKDVEVNKGDIISFKVWNLNYSNTYVTANGVSICGTLAPVSTSNLIELI